MGFVALPGADILNQTHFFRWSKISLKLEGYRAFTKQEQGRGEMREGEHNCSKESKFSRQYLSLHWHQIFFSESVETQESVPRGVLRLSFAWLSLGRQEGDGKFYGTDKLEKVWRWIKNWNPILSMCLFDFHIFLSPLFPVLSPLPPDWHTWYPDGYFSCNLIYPGKSEFPSCWPALIP